MALTRANVETILVKRLNKTMAFVDMATTYNGDNADLADPIGFAIRECGGTTSDYTNPTDDDLTSVDSSDYDKLFDLAEYRLLESIIGNFDKYGLKVGPRSGYQSQVREGLEGKVKRVIDILEAKYGYNAPMPEFGKVVLDIADHNETRQ